MSFPLFEKYVKNDWADVLKPEFERNKVFYKTFDEKIKNGYDHESVYPRSIDNIFTAFRLTSFEETKVVIIGEAPYPSEAAHGLSFSVNSEAEITDTPSSLRNIFRELESDKKVDFETPSTMCLSTWAGRGVLLLNTRLTLGIKNLRWQKFIDAVIYALNTRSKIVFVLLGKKAVKKRKLISTKHEKLLASHPSDQGYKQSLTENRKKIANPFFNSHLFSQVNILLCENNCIDWRL